MGRTAWGDVVRNARTLSRLIWFHVPLRLTPKTAEEMASGKVNRPVSELNKVMAEKRMAMDLIEGRVFFDLTQTHSQETNSGLLFPSNITFEVVFILDWFSFSNSPSQGK